MDRYQGGRSLEPIGSIMPSDQGSPLFQVKKWGASKAPPVILSSTQSLSPLNPDVLVVPFRVPQFIDIDPAPPV